MGKDRTTKKSPLAKASLLTILISGLASGAAIAENNERRVIEGDRIRIPVGQQPGSPNIPALPRTGESRSAVLNRLGEPEQRNNPVGDPPISSWDYPDLVVYFEHDHVIHAVRKHRPLEQAGQNTRSGN